MNSFDVDETPPGLRSAVSVRRGVVEALPLFPPNLAWGIAFGAAAGAAGLAPGWSAVMSAAAWSGTAQMGALAMLGQSAVAVFVTSLVVSARFLPMSIALGTSLGDMAWWKRGLLACLLADANFALLTRAKTGRAGYLVGTWLVMYAAWVVGTGLGALAGPLLPRPVLSLAGAVIAFVIALLALETCTSPRLALAAAAAAVATVAVAAVLPVGLAVLLAAVVTAGVVSWRKQS